jgi:hypothetical protein
MDIYIERAIEQARERGFLYAHAYDQEAIFIYRHHQKQLGLPAIVLAESERHVEISAMLSKGVALTEWAKIQIAVQFVYSMSPFGLTLCNDRRMVVTRLTFDAGIQLAQWLSGYLSDSANLLPGERERHHERIEVAKRADGSLRIVQGATYFREQRRAA